MLRIHAFGGCRIERDGVRLDELSGQRKGLALLALLAAAGDRGMTRETVVGFIWPEIDDERARISLKQLIHSLRSQLHAPDLLLPTAELRLNSQVITSDVGDFRTAVGKSDHESAATLHAGVFLDGFYLKGADEFERWAATERASYALSAARAVEAMAAQSAERGDNRAAVDWWRRLASADPLSARAASGLMLGLEAAGERAAALQHARVYEQLMQMELGVTPDDSVLRVIERLRAPSPVASPAATATEDETRRPDSTLVETEPAPGIESVAHAPDARSQRRRRRLLLATLAASVAAIALWMRSGRDTATVSAAMHAGPGRAASGRPSVAVLPFANTSGNPANEPFSDGLTDELIATLSGIDGLRVAGRTSSFALKGKRLGVRAVADTLGVASVLEGSVRRDGQRLKIAAQLVNTSDGAVLWSQTYDRELVDVFSVQEEIARAIGSVLRLKLVADDASRPMRRPTEDPVAHDLYLRARYLMNLRPSREGAARGEELFRQAIARDPSYASAYAGLSDIHARLAIFGYGRPQQEFASARSYALRALALDSSSAEAHTALAHVLCMHDFDWKGSEREFRRAISLGRAYTFARVVFAVCLSSENRFAEGLAQLDTAREIDPLAPMIPNMRGRLLVGAGEPDLGIRSLNEALELNPQFDLAHQQLGHAYLQKRMYPEAIAEMRRAALVSGIRDSAELAYVYAVAGQREEARRLLALLTRSPDRYIPPVHVAMAHAALGDIDEAFRLLERGYAERASFMGGVKTERAFRPLHSDPRWARLLNRMGLAP